MSTTNEDSVKALRTDTEAAITKLGVDLRKFVNTRVDAVVEKEMIALKAMRTYIETADAKLDVDLREVVNMRIHEVIEKEMMPRVSDMSSSAAAASVKVLANGVDARLDKMFIALDKLTASSDALFKEAERRFAITTAVPSEPAAEAVSRRRKAPVTARAPKAKRAKRSK